MNRKHLSAFAQGRLAACLAFLFAAAFAAPLFAISPADAAKLPPPAAHEVNFEKELKPLLEASCVKCHAKGKEKGGLSIETSASFRKGGETGPALEPGKSAESLVVEMVAGLDPEMVMPKKGARWTPEQVGLLRAWIDQGAHWPAEVTFAKPPPRNLARPALPPQAGEAGGNLVDRMLAPYFVEHSVAPGVSIDDAAFARRAYLDLVGLLPTPEQLRAFTADPAPDKRAALVRNVLANKPDYAAHWLSFWNDLLRNDYRGAGFIDGGRKQISEWLYNALVTNKPYNQFVAELVNASPQTLGFTAGIIWRGTVPAPMTPPLQAAQSVSQVFLGINLKCASCHDSFVSDWTLSEAYGMAALFADGPLELVHCDKPTGRKAAAQFLYPQLGSVDASAAKPDRMKRAAELLTSPENGRLSRTIVNRFWARLFGRGLVEPVDDMEQPAWSAPLLDALAADFEANGFDLRRLLETLATSRAYQMPSVEPQPEGAPWVFRGPQVRRLSAEQFADAVSALTGSWASLPATLEFDLSAQGAVAEFRLPRWIWTSESLDTGNRRAAWRYARVKADAAQAATAAAQKAIDSASPQSAALMEKARTAARDAAEMAEWAAQPPGDYRHKVVFRKKFTLPARPPTAYATVLASQRWEVQVNGTTLKHKMSDGSRNDRVRLYDFAPALQAGENVIAISVESHTEKMMNETERKEFPASAQHLNQLNGFAFYLRCRLPEGAVEIVSDETWRVQRAPDGAWSAKEYADSAWSAASLLLAGVTPVDEGPGLEPIRRKDFANLPALLGPALRCSSSVSALTGEIRAALLASDPLQMALDRPNREIVIPVRAAAATTIQALELTNGSLLAGRLEMAGKTLVGSVKEPAEFVDRLFRHSLARPPSEAERATALELLGSPATPAGIADLLWSLAMLPEFQFIR